VIVAVSTRVCRRCDEHRLHFTSHHITCLSVDWTELILAVAGEEPGISKSMSLQRLFATVKSYVSAPRRLLPDSAKSSGREMVQQVEWEFARQS